MRLVVPLFLLMACTSTPKQPATPSADGTAPAWFVGAWKREWFTQGPTSERTERQIVRDLQTPTVFASVRVDLARPVFTAKSFDELDDAQLAYLLGQRGGFAGAASFKGDVALWDHELDFQPVGATDTARLERVSPTSVLEKGLDGEFTELWWSIGSGDGKYLGIRIRPGARTERMLVVVGDHFIYARNRARELPTGAALPALVAETKATRAQIIEMLDCEFSYGTVRSGRVPWEIRYSTLPWREGQSLDFVREVTIDGAGAPAPRTPIAGWSVPVNTFAVEDLRTLFAD